MSTVDALMLSVQVHGVAESPFEAGQQIALQVLQSGVQQLSGGGTVAIMAGLFSGAMNALQAMVGDDELTDLFARFLATGEPTDKAAH